MRRLNAYAGKHKKRMKKPKLKMGTTIELVPGQGIILSINEFISTYAGLLEDNEQQIVQAYCSGFPTLSCIPSILTRVWTRSKWLQIGKETSLQASRRGTRNAFLPNESIIFKGCRPAQEVANFPDEYVPFGKDSVSRSEIPFGVLTAERTMREILGHCFFIQNDLPLRSIPQCVYEYKSKNHTLGYCLVLQVEADDRIEALMDYPDFSVADILTADVIRSKSYLEGILDDEMPLKNINVLQYAEKKSDMLIKMNQNGGFRGLLNSNIGNDVVKFSSGYSSRFFLCDFDTFKVIKIPERASTNFMRAFLIQCFVEVVKSSLPILDYVNAPVHANPKVISECARNIFFTQSSLWRAYQRRFEGLISALGWDMERVKELLIEVYETPAFVEVLLDQVFNYHTFKAAKPASESMYIPHN